MEDRPPSLPDVWGEGDRHEAAIDATRQKTVPIKTIDLGPLGEFPQKTLIVVLAVIGAVVLAALMMVATRPEKPAVLGSLDRAIAVSADGSRLLVGMRDGSVRVLDSASNKIIATAQMGAPILAVTFGPRDSAIVLVDAGAPDPVNEKVTEPQPTLQILAADLSSRVKRTLQPHAHDVVWSEALQSAVVLSGGENDLHASLEIFSERPMGVATSTPELIELPTYNSPRHLAVSADGNRLAVTFATSRRANLLIYDPPARRIVSSLLVPGTPAGVAVNTNGTAVFVASPDQGAITRVTGGTIKTVNVVANSSAWPAEMVAATDSGKALTSGALDVPEADFDSGRISNQGGLLPTEHHASSSLVLTPDGKTLYVTFEDRNGIGAVDVPSMQWLREIELH